MGARLKAILAGVGVLLLTVLTLGGWALVERRGRKAERDRADRLQAGLRKNGRIVWHVRGESRVSG